MKGCARQSCKSYKTVARQNNTSYMSRTEAVRFAAFLRQPCDKAHGYLGEVSRLSQDKCMAGELLPQLYEYVACLAAVLWQPCVSCGRRTSFRKRKQIAKKMNMSKIRCGSLATLFLRCCSRHREDAVRNQNICLRR